MAETVSISRLEATRVLEREPRGDEIEKYFVAKGASGWIIENTYREELINRRLKECVLYKSGVETAAIELSFPSGAPSRTEVSLFQNPYVMAAMVAAAGWVGYRLGQKTN